MNKDKIIKFLKKHYKALIISVVVAVGIMSVSFITNKINHQRHLLKNATYEIETLTEQIKQLTNNVDDLKNDNLTLQGNLDYVNSLTVDIIKERDNLQKENTELQDKISFNETRIEYLEQRNSELNEDLKKN